MNTVLSAEALRDPRGVQADVLVDLGREHFDPGRDAQEQLHLEGFQPAHDDEDHDG